MLHSNPYNFNVGTWVVGFQADIIDGSSIRIAFTSTAELQEWLLGACLKIEFDSLGMKAVVSWVHCNKFTAVDLDHERWSAEALVQSGSVWESQSIMSSADQ